MGNNYSLIGGLGSWSFLQCVMLVVRYGFDKVMPWWVVWFPSLIVAGTLAVVIAGLIIWFIVTLIVALCER